MTCVATRYITVLDSLFRDHYIYTGTASRCVLQNTLIRLSQVSNCVILTSASTYLSPHERSPRSFFMYDIPRAGAKAPGSF